MENIISKLNDLEILFKSQWYKKALTLDEVAAYTGLSKSYLYKLTSTGGIPCYKPRSKMVYFDREEIDQWLLQNPIKTKAEIDAEAATYVASKNQRK
ncbi:MAG: helix-turn-helix domain-containing protein [Saprospiraceae bacterium]